MPFRRVQAQPPSKQVRRGATLSVYVDDLTEAGVERLLALATPGELVSICRSYSFGNFGGTEWETTVQVTHAGAGAVVCQSSDPEVADWWMFALPGRLISRDVAAIARWCNWWGRDDRCRYGDGTDVGVRDLTIPGVLALVLNARPDLAGLRPTAEAGSPG